MALTWTTPTLATGFYGNVQYSFDTPTAALATIVRFRGQLVGPVGTTAFQIGAGGRPLQTASLDASSGLNGVAQVAITSGGFVSLRANTTGVEPVTVVFDGLSIAGEQ
ncbi:hypothetical protein [Anaeromyxobacter oryzae]|uniref:Uncharacterized protein n=1 Tax=Anaeromyxobacter oryzae TaxID=2918170 RepID=A0ABM7WZP1_9BACT|nr:hypothetical protein [Anaeromyxobacter oryzae]BDG04949.1 hypothetical protein AMOR_39450 [Anaeromyxobacter oryzae]